MVGSRMSIFTTWSLVQFLQNEVIQHEPLGRDGRSAVGGKAFDSEGSVTGRPRFCLNGPQSPPG